MRKFKINKRDIVFLIIGVVVVVFLLGKFVLYDNWKNYKFANQMENIAAKNENAVFSIDKIVLYSSANAIDNSEGQTMQDLDVYQFTDMAIYIDNMVDIQSILNGKSAISIGNVTDDMPKEVKEHTVKELYIDNINIDAATNKGEKFLDYKSPEGFGKFKLVNNNKNTENNQANNQGNNAENTNTENNQTSNNNETNNNETQNSNQQNNNQQNDPTVYNGEGNLPSGTEQQTDGENTENNREENNQNEENSEEPKEDVQKERIDFDIIYTNEENEKSNYKNPTFYTDCSNPITLDYINKNIVKGYTVNTQDTQIKFDGNLLQSVGVNLEDIACRVSFDIHIKNNLSQDFICSVSVDVPLNSENRSIYSGYMYGMQDKLQNTYKFFKL